MVVQENSEDKNVVVQENSEDINVLLQEDSEDDEASDDRKKRPRTAFTAAQIKALESEFERNKYLSVSKRMQLSKQLRLTETQVQPGGGMTEYWTGCLCLSPRESELEIE